MIERVQKEKIFHDQRFDDNSILRKNASKFYLVNKHVTNRYIDIISEHCKEKKLLEYGCGTGSKSIQWLKKGAILTGIDISSIGIKKAKKKISDTQYDADYFIMNAENTDFDDETFDIVVGTGIIHHLDLLNSYKELSRILTNEGHAVFIEPLGHNPLINLYRILTPKMRTEDEHPLKIKDIKLIEQYFHKVHIEYYSLFVLLAVPFRKKHYFEKLYGILKKIDDLVLIIPFIKRYAWTSIIHASSPRR
tara:strand:- start:303 stop:1049 length:747 start_codon:yes stop_codon:yes gene_type:complete